jgi:imidazolonepropionase-like amidohydrolase
MRIKTFVAAAAVALGFTGHASAEAVAVTAARMLDVETGRMVERPLVLIRDGRISAVGIEGSVKVPVDAARVDLPGMTLLPGMIDMHVHLDNSPYHRGYTYLQFTDTFWPVLATRHAKDTLEAGFTTVRNVGTRGPAFSDVGLREAIDGGYVTGPRVITAGESFGSTGGHCDSTYLPPSLESKNRFNADSPDAGRQSVRELRKYGAQVIKICATGGVFSRNTEPGQQQLSLAEMKSIVDEAHMQGLRVAAHAHGASGIKEAIRAGVDTIEHASLIDDEGVRLAKEKGAWLSMDTYNTEFTQSEGARTGVLEENLRKDREIADVQRENFRKAHRAGVKMVYGTDAGVYPHGQNGRQFATMVRYGMTPLEAIRTATVNAAQALDRSKDVGSIAVGKYGDLVAVAGDPLQDVGLLANVAFVMKGGTVVKAPR